MKYYSAIDAANVIGLSVVTFRKKFKPDITDPNHPGGQKYFYDRKRINAATKEHRGYCAICGKPFCRLGTYWSACSYRCAKIMRANATAAKLPSYINNFSEKDDPCHVAFKNKVGTRKCICGAPLYVGQYRCDKCKDNLDVGLVSDGYVYGGVGAIRI